MTFLSLPLIFKTFLGALTNGSPHFNWRGRRCQWLDGWFLL